MPDQRLCNFLLLLVTASILSVSCTSPDKEKIWQAPDTTAIPKNVLGDEIRYGRELISQTSFYLGPKGKVKAISNGMNCQNCHLDAGARPFGNNYGSVASLYPKFRARSGSIESIEKRVNDCIERSLNGTALDSLSWEMRAIVAYINWLGKDVDDGESAMGSGIRKLSWLDRAASPEKGNALFAVKCQLCHGKNGEGIQFPDSSGYIYPPSWGNGSFNTGAGLFRIGNYAGFIYNNMPVGATYDKPILTEEEAWDIAAYVLSMPRPNKDFPADWPDVTTKPLDHPFGPYADSFSEQQHKFGPFSEIQENSKK